MPIRLARSALTVLVRKDLQHAIPIYRKAYPKGHDLGYALRVRGSGVASKALEVAATEAETTAQQQRARECWAAANVAEAVVDFNAKPRRLRAAQEALREAFEIHNGSNDGNDGQAFNP